MDYLLLVIVFGMYYVVHFTSVMYAEKMKVLPIYLYSAAFILYLIPLFFIDKDYNSMQNSMLVLNMGVVLYAWIAIKGVWSKPLKLKIEKLTKKPKETISEEQYEKVEGLTISLEASKYKGIISLVISLIFMITMAIKATPELRSEFMEGNPVVWVLFLLIFIIYIFIDIVLWIKRKKFAFIAIRPLFVIFWLIILQILLAINK
ncbi:DUF5080 family protein [Staphylococcus arlettae]|nr:MULTISPECIES: DUF5080 family protein [Staphylococcus]MCG7337690.1 DUF5080 family protein [Staphylococcus sp. ACRSN]PTH22064.1 DUF5080 domain-containing protein [Staphylococcus arlettae]PTJ64205.1 DUF5080 domain-containing protein [Staphylococcus saprophyticus]RIM67391.1 DUF5080 family protein [Staphylococcus arlettae]